MSLAKIVVSGNVTKNPEKRFTQNNLAITSFVIDINPADETLIRVITVGGLAERTAEAVKLGDSVLVDGRMQIEVVKTNSGKDKRVIEINASAVEKVAFGASPAMGATPAAAASKPQEIVQFATEEISEDLIDEDEIPF